MIIYHLFSIFNPEFFHDMLENLAGKKLSKLERETLQLAHANSLLLCFCPGMQ